MICNPFDQPNETWGAEITFQPLAYHPSVDMNNLPVMTSTPIGAITLQTGYAIDPQTQKADIKKIAVSILNSLQSTIVFDIPVGGGTRLFAATFPRGSQTVIAIRHEVTAGSNPIVSRIVDFSLLVVGELPLSLTQGFNLNGGETTSDLFFAPSPSGKMVFMWRGANPQTTAEHVLFRTDSGVTLASYPGSPPANPYTIETFRVCEVATTSHSIKFFQSSASDHVSSSQPEFLNVQWPMGSISLLTSALTISSIAPSVGTAPSKTGSIVIRNNGNDDLKISNIQIASPFSIDSPTIPFCINPLTTQSVVIRFTPVMNADASATLTVTDSNQHTKTALISGKVVAGSPPAPSILIKPNPMVFPKIAGSQTKSLIITNSGDVPLTILAINPSSVPEFSWPSVSQTTLAAHTSLTPDLPITFSPTSTSLIQTTLDISVSSLPQQTVELLGNDDEIQKGELEILYIDSNPPGDDVAGEVIWIGNTSSRNIDLKGCSLTDEIFDEDGVHKGTRTFYTFNTTLNLPPIFSNGVNICQVFTGGNKSNDAGFIRFVGSTQPIWNNSGDTGKIISPEGRIIDEAQYSRGKLFTAFGEIPVTLPERSNVVFDKTIVVPESSGMIDTGIDIQEDDRIDFFGSGTIWAGVFLTGTNGPDGWVGWVQTDPNWPYHTAPDAFSFCLIGSLGQNVFRIGKRLTRIALGDISERLFVGINDDVHGNGNGAFSCRIVVTRSI